MKVSIITVVFNASGTIRNAIESVLSQTYKEIEYIIIDGGSRDGTVDIIASYGNRITKMISQPDEGLYHAMNKGVDLATGEIVGFINADDMINSDDCVTAIVEKFKQSNADAVYGDNIYVDQHNTSKIVRYWRAGEYNKNNFRKGWMPPHLSTYIKRKYYSEFGLFRKDMKIAGDYELMLRFFYKNKLRVIYINKIIARMRAGGISNSSFSNILKANIEVYKSWGLNGLRVSPLIIIAKPIKKIIQFLVKV